MTQNHTEVAVYYFPQYHADPRNDVWHGKGWTEWDLVRLAAPRFPGHHQPLIPEWGYFNEADPIWAAQEIDLAAAHGITTFIYDWYWYEEKPFLHQALEEGFLKAANTQQLKFALMWANHDWLHLFPARLTNVSEVLAGGQVSPTVFQQITDYVIEHYFTRPNYLMLAGAPYFSIYDLPQFIAGVGGLDAARRALAQFRQRVRAQGFADLHLNAIVTAFLTLPGDTTDTDLAATIADLGFSSVGSYTWIHHYPIATQGFPTTPYKHAVAANYAAWDEQATRYGIPYYPNVTMGWDATPRTSRYDRFERRGYPWFPVLTGNTPEAFREALQHARAFLAHDRLPLPLMTINAWNEWTEGSYLLPDTVHGTAYLQAIREVFPPQLPHKK